MKTLLLTFFSIGIIFGISAQNYYPIPTYDVQFRGTSYFRQTSPAYYKKRVHVMTYCVGGANIIQMAENNSNGLTPGIIVYLYSLDERDVLGPYYPSLNDEIIVDVDERAWGVIISSENEIISSVWLELIE